MQLFTVMNDGRILFVCEGTQYILIHLNCHGEIECSSCKSNKLNCLHVRYVKQQIEEQMPELDEFVTLKDNTGVKRRKVTVAVSQEIIPFEAMKCTKIHCDSEDNTLKAFPDLEGKCPSGHKWADEVSSRGVKWPLLDWHCIEDIVVHSRKCAAAECTHTKEFDGIQHGLLNMDTFLISHVCLRDYMHQFVISGYVTYMHMCIMIYMHLIFSSHISCIHVPF